MWSTLDRFSERSNSVSSLICLIYTEAENTPLSALNFFSAFSFGLKDIVFKIKWGHLNEWKYLNCGTLLWCVCMYLYIKKILCSQENIKSFVSSFFGDHDWFFHKTNIIFSLMYHSLLNSMVILVCREKGYLQEAESSDALDRCTWLWQKSGGKLPVL